MCNTRIRRRIWEGSRPPSRRDREDKNAEYMYKLQYMYPSSFQEESNNTRVMWTTCHVFQLWIMRVFVSAICS